MNIRTIALSGVMTALVGAMFGLVVAHVGENRWNATRQLPEHRYAIVGAVLGFGLGGALCAIQQQSDLEDKDEPGA